MINLTEIRERADAALKWANRCDRTKAGCQVPQITKVLNNVPALCDEIERLEDEWGKVNMTAELLLGHTAKLESELERLQAELTESRKRERAAVEYIEQKIIDVNCGGTYSIRSVLKGVREVLQGEQIGEGEQ